MIKKIPLPAAGLILGLFSLGNLLQSYSENLRLFIGALAFLIMLLYIVRIASNIETFKEEMKNPVMASVFACFPMAIMLFSGYLKPFLPSLANIVFYLGILIHIIVIIYFTKQFILNLDIKKIFASYYIVYVGIVVSSLMAPLFSAIKIGQIAFYFGLISFVILFILVNYRYKKIGHPDNPLKPLYCITCAPASLLLAGYCQSFENKNVTLLIVLMVVSQALFFHVWYKLFGYLKDTKFYPSYSAFTFPFVISAIGLKMSTGFLLKSQTIVAGSTFATVLPLLVLIETIIATILVTYALIRYTMNFLKAN